MRKVMMMLAMALMIIGCGKNGKTTDGTEDGQGSSGTTKNAAVSDADRQSDEYIVSRVQSIYDDIFAEYNKANEDESTPTSSPDEKYCSDDWNKALQAVSDYDQQNHPDDIGFFEADYWVMGQDFGDLSVSDSQVVEHDGNKAKVQFDLHNDGEVIPVRLDLQFERGDWFIDDFYEIDHEYDWKKDMKEYVK